MKRGGRPKTLPTSSPCATASTGTGTGGSWTEASAVAAERLADWQQNLSDQVSYNYLFKYLKYVNSWKTPSDTLQVNLWLSKLGVDISIGWA